MAAPAATRTIRTRAMRAMAAPAEPMAMSMGNVPTPKAAMVAAPPSAEPLVTAAANAAYTSPHGIHPHTRPSAHADRGCRIGTRRWAAGAMPRQTGAAARSTHRRARDTPAMYKPTANIIRAAARRSVNSACHSNPRAAKDEPSPPATAPAPA
jgi:hypothetical protein